MEGILFLPNVKAERRNGLVRHVQLVAHAVTSQSVALAPGWAPWF
jgi:hypothetical protein